MTKRTTPTQKAMAQRLTRLKAFGEVLDLAIALKFLLNWVFDKVGLDLHFQTYEIALIWLFCV